MAQTTISILAQHSVLKTVDPDRARHCVSQKFCDHKLDISDSGKALSLNYNHVAGQNVSVNYLHYGANVTIDPGMLCSFYLLQIPLSGNARVQHRGEDVVAGVKTATVLNPDRPTKMQWQTNCRKLLLQIDKSHLDLVAETLTGAPLPGPVRFRTGVDLNSQNGAALKRLIMNCVSTVEHGQAFQGKINASDLQIEFDLASALLMLQQSNVSHIVHAPCGGATTRSLKLAMDYIHANLHEAISLSDIALHAEVSMRMLQKGFSRRYGLTPMRYLKNARLDVARYQLMARQNTPPVTLVAFNSGFSHLGRFAQEYKERFGCSPNETKSF